MSNTPTISVLVPVRDGAAFLAQAIDSLRGQSFDNWEAMLCSVDGTHVAPINDPRIHIVEAGAATEADALAHATTQASGDFLCLLDGDDLIELDAFESLLATFRDQPDIGMAYSRHVLVDSNGGVIAPGPLCEIPYSPEALLMDFMTGPLQLVRRDAWLQAGGLRNEFPDALDYDLCLRLSETCAIVHVPRVLYRRRVHPRSPMVLRWVEQIEDRYRAFVAAVQRRGLDAKYDCALEIDSWHVLQPLKPFGGVGNWR